MKAISPNSQLQHHSTMHEKTMCPANDWTFDTLSGCCCMSPYITTCSKQAEFGYDREMMVIGAISQHVFEYSSHWYILHRLIGDILSQSVGIATIIGWQSEGSLIRSGCLIHNGTYLTLSLTLTITLTLLTLTVTVRVTLTLLTLLTLILDIGLSNPRIIEPSDYRYITIATSVYWKRGNEERKCVCWASATGDAAAQDKCSVDYAPWGYAMIRRAFKCWQRPGSLINDLNRMNKHETPMSGLLKVMKSLTSSSESAEE